MGFLMTVRCMILIHTVEAMTSIKVLNNGWGCVKTFTISVNTDVAIVIGVFTM